MTGVQTCALPIWNSIAALFTEIRRITQGVDAQGNVVLDGSADVLVMDGCRFVKDKDATSNAIYYLNTNYLRWQTLPFVGSSEQDVIATLPLQTGMGDSGITAAVVRLARTGAASKFSLMTQCQLVVKKPTAMGKRLNVA